MKGKTLKQIWYQIPPDYYDKKNLFQKIWHGRKMMVVVSLMKTALKKIENKPKILDVGCANGTHTYFLSQVFSESTFTGIDIYQPAIKAARKKYPFIRFGVADAHRLPFKNNYFGVLVCLETLEHLVDPSKALEEMKRVIKPGGYLILELDTNSYLFRTVWLIWERTFGKVWQGAHLWRLHPKRLEKLLSQKGFAIEKKQFFHLRMGVCFLLNA
jgi:ubiquinone/menaquinone biosynthesis C-methylase UbiE